MNDERVRFDNPRIGQCFCHSACVLRNGIEEVRDVIEPYRQDFTAQQDPDDAFHSDEDSGDDEDMQHDTASTEAETRTYAYVLDSSIMETIYGSIWRGCLLHPFTRPNGTFIWKVTETSCAIKMYELRRMRQNHGSAENPLRELAAMQLLQRYLGGANEDFDIGRAEQIMFERNVIMPFEALIDELHLFSIMPYCPGNDLFAALEDSRAFFREDQARDLFKQILNGMDTLQMAGICHRDVSMENILINRDGSGIVIDLGMCFKIPYSETDVTNQRGTRNPTDCRNRQRLLAARDRVCGQPYYIAPEIVANEKSFDGHAIDIWGAGVILYFMVVGQPPWAFADPVADFQFREISTGSLVDCLENVNSVDHLGNENPENVNLRLSADLVDLLQRMFFRDPRDRLGLEQIRAHPWMNPP